jgi:hypothetical protein
MKIFKAMIEALIITTIIVGVTIAMGNVEHMDSIFDILQTVGILALVYKEIE